MYTFFTQSYKSTKNIISLSLNIPLLFYFHKIQTKCHLLTFNDNGSNPIADNDNLSQVIAGCTTHYVFR